MRVAQDDLSPHTDQLVHEEHPGLEHLLVHQDQPAALGRRHDRDGHEVRRESGPRLILELRDVPAEIGLDFSRLLGRDHQIIPFYGTADSQTLEPQASRAQVLRLVLREGAALVTVGTVLGFLGAVAMAKILASLISMFVDALRFGTTDPVLLLGAPLLLAAVAMLASVVPARRATRVDPMVALRYE